MRLLVGKIEIGETMNEAMSDNQMKFGMFAVAFLAIAVLGIIGMMTHCHIASSEITLKAYQTGQEPARAPVGTLGLPKREKADDK